MFYGGSFCSNVVQVTSLLTWGLQLNDIWEFHVDNDFAMAFLSNLVTSAPGSKAMSPKQLCAKCQELELLAPHFNIVDEWDDLEENAHACDFCRIRWDICSHLDPIDFPVIRFERDRSMLKLSGRYPPVMSLRRDPGEF